MTTDEPINLRDEEIQAIERIAQGRDGMLLHRYLRRILEGCRVTDSDGALQRSEGARILARDLMGHMARGIEGSSGRPASTEPILSASTGPAGSGRRPLGSRRVGPDPESQRFLDTNGAEPS